MQALQSQLDFQEQSMVEKSLVSRQEAKIRELDTKLEFEKTQVKRLEVRSKNKCQGVLVLVAVLERMWRTWQIGGTRLKCADYVRDWLGKQEKVRVNFTHVTISAELLPLACLTFDWQYYLLILSFSN